MKKWIFPKWTEAGGVTRAEDPACAKAWQCQFAGVEGEGRQFHRGLDLLDSGVYWSGVLFANNRNLTHTTLSNTIRTYHKIHLLKAYDVVIFSIITRLYNCHHYLIPEGFCQPKKTLHTH